MAYLPKTIVKSADKNPKKLFLYSHTKVGKTTLVSGLNNCLIIDTEDGSNFVDGYKINIREILRNEPDKNAVKLLYEISQELKNSDTKFDYIAIDTVTALQDIAEEYATMMYKELPLGKNFKGRSVLELPQGAGYYWLRRAFSNIYSWFEGLSKCLILLGHIKLSSILKDGKELNARDIELVGKLKQMITADCDAIGYLYRNKENPNQVIVSFKTELLDLATGARPEHLRNKEFVLSEYDPETKQFKFFWNNIFIN